MRPMTYISLVMVIILLIDNTAGNISSETKNISSFLEILNEEWIQLAISYCEQKGDLVNCKDNIEIDKPYEVLELCPFVSPALMGPTIRYFDILDREGLFEKAMELNNSYYISRMTALRSIDYEIDYVEPFGDLKVIDKQFPFILSSHCLEHTVNLLKHLLQIYNILQPGGKLFVILPDKRFTYDHHRPLSTLSDILLTFYEDPKVHSLRTIVEASCESLESMPNSPDVTSLQRNIMKNLTNNSNVLLNDCVEKAIIKYNEANGSYIDAHRWIFTDEWFHELITSLNLLKLLPLRIEKLYRTCDNCTEFYAILVK